MSASTHGEWSTPTATSLGASVALRPDDEVLAHALLLNKFLAAADQIGAVPITGKPYIHQLIGDKCRVAKSGSDGALDPIAVRAADSIVPES